jgi:hypothetical protein
MEAIIGCGVINTPLVQDVEGSKIPIQRTPRQGTVRVVEGGSNWPTTSATLCWHCCHPFAGPPVPMPIRFDDKLRLYHVTGTFCSWPCVKAYNNESASYKRQVDSTLITKFYRECTRVTAKPGAPQAIHIRAAPPRLALRAFGGSMSIEEFRDCDANIMVLPPKMIVHRPVIEEVPSRLRQRPTQQQLQDTVCFKDATAQNDMLRLRRPKPLASHNLLVKTMGVQILAQAKEG